VEGSVKPIERLRKLGAQYWKPVISLADVLLAAFNGLKEIGLLEKDLPGTGTTPATKWTLIGIGVFTFVIIRFPKVALAITRLIIGPPPPQPLPEKRIFRGTLPYNETPVLS